jgi:hypothetical protein
MSESSSKLIPAGLACSSVSRTSLRQMRAAIATKASGLFFATLQTASKPSSAQTSAKSRIKPCERAAACLAVFQPDCRFGRATVVQACRLQRDWGSCVFMPEIDWTKGGVRVPRLVATAQRHRFGAGGRQPHAVATADTAAHTMMKPRRSSTRAKRSQGPPILATGQCLAV